MKEGRQERSHFILILSLSNKFLQPYPNQYGGRTSLDKRYRKPGQIDASPPECNYRQQTPQAEDQQNQPSLDKEITATPQHSTIAKKVWKPRRKAEADADPETLKYEVNRLQREIVCF